MLVTYVNFTLGINRENYLLFSRSDKNLELVPDRIAQRDCGIPGRDFHPVPSSSIQGLPEFLSMQYRVRSKK